MKINLRGHHLLCIQGFQGYGYNEEFINNMNEIKNLINDNNIKIAISNCPDDICKACPNLKNNICKNKEYNEEIIKMDNEVLNNIKINKVIPSKDLFKKVNTIFNTKDKIENICKNCGWFEKCLWANQF